MSDFVFDEELLTERMVTATEINDARGFATLYGVVCTNAAGEASHGGFITADMPEALKVAREANEGPESPLSCKYIPVALGLAFDTFAAVLTGLQGPNGPMGEDA